jgi:tetratricopeptide (TPR) repeat protein
MDKYCRLERSFGQVSVNFLVADHQEELYSIGSRMSESVAMETTETTSPLPAPASAPAVKSKLVMPQDNEGKIAMAKSLKEEGNALFKEKQFTKAKRAYNTAIAYIKGLPGRPTKITDPFGQMAAKNVPADKMSDESAAELDDLECALKTNIATCFVKLGKGFDAIAAANDALLVKPTYWKAMLRKAEGKLVIKDYEACLKVLEEVESVAPDESAAPTIKKIRADCQKGIQAENAKQKKAFANVFSKLNLDEDK